MEKKKETKSLWDLQKEHEKRVQAGIDRLLHPDPLDIRVWMANINRSEVNVARG